MINGIDYLKKMYPDRDDEDYQPSGLDLRVGRVFTFNDNSIAFLADGNIKLKLGRKMLNFICHVVLCCELGLMFILH